MIRQATIPECLTMCKAISYSPSNNFRAILEERTMAMVGYDHWTPNSVQMHVWCPKGRISPYMVREAFRYPFGTRDMAMCMIPAENERSLRLAKRAGFRETYRIRDGWEDGVDIVLLEARKEWVGSKTS